MFQEAFEKLELEEVATILDRLNPEFDGGDFDPVNTTIMALDIPFYPGCRLLDISDHSVVPAKRRFAVYGDDAAVVLDFTNAPIYRLNKNLPVKLNEENVADYLRFFFTYVRGKHGRFIICESVDDIHWKEEPPPAARKAIGKMIKPITFKEKAKDGIFNLEVCMVFKDALFKCDAKISKDGQMNLTDEELLIEDMPVLDDVFGQ